MNIAQELSIVRDNIAEYGMTNITQLEYDAIYQQGRADGYSQAENDYHKQTEKDRKSSYDCGYKQGRNDAIDDIASTILTEMEFGVGGSIENFLVEYFEQLKEQK